MEFLSRFFQGHEGKLLDLGCREGHIRNYLPKDIEYTGVDVIKRFKKCQFFNLNDLNKSPLSFQNKSFDFILASAIIEHLLLDLNIFMHELKRVLKDKGFMIITYPNNKAIYLEIKNLIEKLIKPLPPPRRTVNWPSLDVRL
jgi:SAM-dependent methyltransferase